MTTQWGEQYPGFKPIPRLNREVIVTEKIDGTNGLVRITEDFVRAGSRNRWLEPTKGEDNYGFAAWVEENAAGLREVLGEGDHYGEWFGSGIQKRHYGLTNGEKRWALFNTSRWTRLGVGSVPGLTVVPVLATGIGIDEQVDKGLRILRNEGSYATEHGFNSPEGVVAYHVASREFFKVTLEGDQMSKQEAESRARQLEGITA